MKNSKLPFQIRIATPCPARWEDMGGDDRVRFCDQCKKNVYNLAAMSTEETLALIESKPGRLCARVYQRADGRVLTEDCPVCVARYWRRMKRLAAGVAATLLFIVLGTAAAASERGQQPGSNGLRERVLMAMDDAQWKVKGWFGIQRPSRMVMGEIAMPIAVSPPSQTPATASTSKK